MNDVGQSSYMAFVCLSFYLSGSKLTGKALKGISLMGRGPDDSVLLMFWTPFNGARTKLLWDVMWPKVLIHQANYSEVWNLTWPTNTGKCTWLLEVTTQWLSIFSQVISFLRPDQFCLFLTVLKWNYRVSYIEGVMLSNSPFSQESPNFLCHPVHQFEFKRNRSH